MAGVFIIGAILFFIRMIALLFLLVVSPFAFIGSILPRFEHMAQEWWSGLFKRAFFAPIFLFFLYITVKIIEGSSAISNTAGEGSLRQGVFSQIGAGQDYTWGDLAIHTSNLVTGGGAFDVVGNTAILAYFAIVFGFLFGTIMVANKLSMEGAKFATDTAKTFGGFVGAHTVGRAAQRIRNSDRMANWMINQQRAGGLRAWGSRWLVDKPLSATYAAKFGGSAGYEARVAAKKKDIPKLWNTYGRYQEGPKVGLHRKFGGKRGRSLMNEGLDANDPTENKMRRERELKDTINLAKTGVEKLATLEDGVSTYGFSPKKDKNGKTKADKLVESWNEIIEKAGKLDKNGQPIKIGTVIYETNVKTGEMGVYHDAKENEYLMDKQGNHLRNATGNRYYIGADGKQYEEGVTGADREFIAGEQRISFRHSDLNAKEDKNLIQQLNQAYRSLEHDSNDDLKTMESLDSAGSGGAEHEGASDH